MLVPWAFVVSGESGETPRPDTAASRQSRQCGVRPSRKRREASDAKTTCTVRGVKTASCTMVSKRR